MLMPRSGQTDLVGRQDISIDIPGSAHLVGICGSGMKALAELLTQAGWRLSGSDLTPANRSIELLCSQGLNFHLGHLAENVPVDVDCLIYSPAIRPDNPERIEAQRRGMSQLSYSQMLGRLLRSQEGICIAGTHGKSTTTAMVGWVLAEAGYDPSIVVGAELCDTGRSGQYGKGKWAVVESCEFNYSFLDFEPAHAIILNIETDHFDCFADLPSLVTTFAKFAERIPKTGVLLWNADSQAASEAAKKAISGKVTFGVSAASDWCVANILHLPNGQQFDVIHHGKSWGHLTLRLHGDHNVQNALAAAALCYELGLNPKQITAGLASFGGVKRRFEVVGKRNGVTLIDDYAHHPTAVRASLRTARSVYGTRRIRVVFQPHQVSRTMALMDDFAESFDDADEIEIVPVFAARERVLDEPTDCSRELVRRIAERGKSCRFAESLDRIILTLDDAAQPGDVLIAMGAGDIDRINHEFI